MHKTVAPTGPRQTGGGLMIEVVRFPSVFQAWERTEAIIRKYLDGQISEDEESEVISRFKEVYDRLPSGVGEISLPLDGLAHLSEKDLDSVYNALGSAVDQVQEGLQTFAGQVLGEIFALVLELERTRTRLDRKTVA